MKQGWANNGQPLDDGRLCYVIDLEDGSRPIKTYGKTVEEVLEKVARTAAHAEVAVTTARRPQTPTPVSVAKPAQPARRPITADEQLIATADLSNAAKAPQAIVKLFEAETGLDVRQLQAQKFGDIAVEWRRNHPEFYDHPANVKLLTETAIREAGGLNRVTYESLETAFQDLQAGGFLVRESEAQPITNNEPTPIAPQPRETPAPSGARPRGGVFATTYRSARIGSGEGARSSQNRLKYTREQIDNMSLEKMRRLIESGDRDYASAVEFYSQPR